MVVDLGNGVVSNISSAAWFKPQTTQAAEDIANGSTSLTPFQILLPGHPEGGIPFDPPGLERKGT